MHSFLVRRTLGPKVLLQLVRSFLRFLISFWHLCLQPCTCRAMAAIPQEMRTM